MTLLTDEAVRQRLIEGIHGRTLAATCRTLLAKPPGTLTDAARALATAGLVACEAVSRETRAARTQMMARLSEAGIPARAIGGREATGDLQFQTFSLDVDPGHLGAALAAAAAEGYSLPLPTDSWTVAALRRFASHLDLARPDAVSMRMQLRWSARQWPRSRLTPDPVDLGLVRLPPPLWPLHLLVKPVRVLAERMAGKRLHDRLGLFTGAVNLATPGPLVTALLELAAPTTEDVLVDLGCGDGRIIMNAARRYGCRAIGIERNQALASRARHAVTAAGLADKVSIVEGDLRAADLASATIFMMFLPGPLVAEILCGVLARMRPGARLIAHEQARLDLPLTADSTLPLFVRNAVTVAHIWRPPRAAIARDDGDRSGDGAGG